MKSLKLLIATLILTVTVSSAGNADTVINYADQSPLIGWLLPFPNGETAMAMRFTNANAFDCTLKVVSVGLIDDPLNNEDIGGNLLFAVFSVDSTGTPALLLFGDTVLNSDFINGYTEPLNIVNLDISSQGLIFKPGEQWAVAVSSQSPSVSVVSRLTFASDSGVKPSQRWYEFVPTKGGWARANCCHNDIDVNMHIYSTISTPPVNNPPEFISSIYDFQTDEGNFAAVPIEATDPEQDFVTLTLGINTFPPDAFLDQFPTNSGFAELKWQTDFTDSGFYSAEIIADDGKGGSANATYTLIVNNVPQPPVFAPIGDWQINESGTLEFPVSATDSDDDSIQLGVISTNIPEGDYSFNLARSEASGTFVWQTDFADSGTYFVIFGAYDGKQLSTDSIGIIVTDILCADPAVSSFSLSGIQSVSKGPNLFSRLSLDLTNIGETDFNDSVFVGLYLSVDSIIATNDLLLTGGREQLGPIALNDIVNFPIGGSIPFAFPNGLAYLGIVIDENEESFECNESNNTAYIPVNVVLNIPPVLDPINDTTIDEGQPFTFNVTGSDSDGESVTFEVFEAPFGSGFSDNDNGTATFDWTPGFDQAGEYSITFRIVDQREESDEQLVRITVNNINQPPQFELVDDQFVTEGNTLEFFVSAFDLDGDEVVLGYSSPDIPGTASFIDNGDGSGTFNWTPTFFDAANYTAYLTANDGRFGTAVDTVEIIVFNDNQTPVLDFIGDKFVNENDTLQFIVTASDIDDDAIGMQIVDSDLPDFQFIQVSTKTSFQTYQFTFVPTSADSGTYTATFVAFDEGEADSETISIYVNNINRPPALVEIGDFLRAEGDTVFFPVIAFDPDFDSMSLNIIETDLPASAVLADSGFGGGIFTWPTTFGDAGTYFAIIEVSDYNGGFDYDTINFLITGVNQPPVLDPTEDVFAQEGDTVDFAVTATDADGDSIVMRVVSPTLPPGATFSDFHNGQSNFNWITNFDNAGTYNVIFRAEDTSGAFDHDTVTINVFNSNRPPVYQIIGSQEGDEGQTLAFVISATDPDDDILSYFLEGANIPSAFIFDDSGNGRAYFEWTPNFNEAGLYSLLIYLDDNRGSSTEIDLSITVNNVNQPPVFEALDDQEVDEDQSLNFTVYVSDSDEDFPSIQMSAPTLPTATFNEDGDVPRGDFSLNASSDDIGVHQVIFIADDLNGGVTEDTVIITVNDVNFPPEFFALPDTTIFEFDTLELAISAYDVDGDLIILSIFGTDISGGGLIDNGDGTGSFNWRPNYSDQGIDSIIFRATSTGGLFAEDTVQITVLNVNQAPVLVEIDNYTIAEGDTLAFDVFATDDDGDFVTLKVTSEPPSSAFLDQIGSGLGTFYWMPGSSESGFYTFTFTADDGFDGVDVDSAYFIVTNANQPPVLDSIGTQLFTEGNRRIFVIEASDPDGFIPIITASNLPSGALLGQGDGVFVDWTPGYDQAGDYFVTFYATDEFNAVDSEVVLFRVFNVNRPPQLNPLNDTVIAENQALHLNVTASDPDGGVLFLSTFNQPLGSSFIDNGNGTGSFDWAPNFDQSDDYIVEFVVSDGSEDVSIDSVNIIVTDVNRPPVLEDIGHKFTFEGDSLSFFVYGFDADGGSIELSIVDTNLPPEAEFYQILNKDTSYQAGQFVWAPTFGDSGVYTATFVASDGQSSDSEKIIISVSDIPCTDLDVATFTLNGPQQISVDKPFQTRLNLSLQNLGPISVDSQFTLSFYLADDPLLDGFGKELHLGLEYVQLLPLGGPFAISFANELRLDYDTPLGPAYLIVLIDQNQNFTDCDPANNYFSIPFEVVPNISPVLDPIGNKEVDEGETFSFYITASDLDLDALYYDYFTEGNLPGDPSLSRINSDSAYFEMTPDFGDAGDYDVTFIVYDTDKGGGNSDEETITITVNNVNRPPVLDPIGEQTFTERQYMQFGVNGSDPDGDNLTFSSTTVPESAEFYQITLGGALFAWTPNSSQSGQHFVTFYLSDGFETDSELVAITVIDVPCPDLSIADFSLDDPQQISFYKLIQSRLNLSIQNAGESAVNDNVALTFYVSEDSSVNCDCNIEPIGFQLVDSVPVNGPYSVDLTNDLSLPFNESFGTGPAWLCVVIDENDTYQDCNTSNNYFCIPVDLGFNITPILDPIGDKEVDEGEKLSFVIIAFDPDFDILYMDVDFDNSCECIDINFIDSGNGHAYFEWTPNFDQAGDYSFEFYAYDSDKRGGSFDNEVITIKVNNVNRAPEIDSLQDTLTYDEGEFIAFRVSASDPDDDCFELSMVSPNLPPEALFDYVFDCVDYGDFSWTPNFGDAGTYHAIFVADDLRGGVGEDTVVIVVNNINGPPVFDEIPFSSINENEALILVISATDIDGTIPVLSAEINGQPLGDDFVNNGNGTATYTWTPDCSQSGEYGIRCFAKDDSGLTDTSLIYIEVAEACTQQLTVVTATCIECAPPQFYTDILVSDNDFAIVFNKYLIESSISENISISSTQDASLDYYYDVKNKAIRIYPQYSQFLPIDTILVTLTNGIYDLDESSLDSNYNLTYTTGPVVYPGDCNNDGTVNEIDVLSIGLFWNNQGPDREVGGDYYLLDFSAQPAHFEEQGNGKWEPFSGVFADVDGSGIVDANDLCGIAINFAETVNEDIAPKAGGGLNQNAALSQVGSKVLEQMRDALIECPESEPKAKMLEVINNALSSSTVILPTEIELHQNYPNPFNPATTIEFSLPKAEHAVLEIYNMLGQRVVKLVDEKVEAGYKTVVWNGTDYTGKSVASGIYFYRLNTETKEIIKRMLLIK